MSVISSWGDQRGDATRWPRTARRGVGATEDERLRAELRARGWRSDRYASPEYSEEFEWPESRPAPRDHGSVASGTVVYLEPGVYWVFAAQDDDAWRPPKAVYRTAGQLIADLDAIETWRVRDRSFEGDLRLLHG